MSHTFHIPVLGLGYSIDTPVKVAHFGISSVISIVDDELIERMRRYYYKQLDEDFEPISKSTEDYRARRITDYLNLIRRIADQRFKSLIQSPFQNNSEIDRYFQLLPASSSLKAEYEKLRRLPGTSRTAAEARLRAQLTQGEIDVNIMSKVDKVNRDGEGESLGDMYTDALAAMRGFAESNLRSSLVLSAGMNPRLYSYLENFPDFFPDSKGGFKKKLILKVSEFRSALIQAKFLAKKGIWVSEFRVESGLNCGGHAFATEGYLLGPVLEEFKVKREEMRSELFELYRDSIASKGCEISQAPKVKVTVQGGIGTAAENDFLIQHYQLDATGWGSPFLLVPEVTNVDQETLDALATSESEDYYVSDSSPLGVLFNNFRKSSAERQRLDRIAKGRPGSPCHKRYLVSDTTFTKEPICTASRQFQNLKIRELRALNPVNLEEQIDKVTEKLCLCDGLTTAALLKNNLLNPRENKAVAICPGPNLAWFSGILTLDELVGHIYGKIDLLSRKPRPHMFINELRLYVDYLKKDMQRFAGSADVKKEKYFAKFKDQLLNGIAYYRELIPLLNEPEAIQKEMLTQLASIENELVPVSSASEAACHIPKR
ncbi:hypothetical protein DYBT9623_02113 [Dyadobacter sp. CECT 9623]|uniref:Uncharacterized protein n=1 Tax=Dyadobacter linearis TaxID=2823330 RepID=A0ABM8UPS0_9BACT|nr:hypothetical protein [Dyadobacter sp. CECT 9623]CAG5069377.1 hypothetical protein DYBT9623_02113 [Dyadobacter sp. CECT 9623]